MPRLCESHYFWAPACIFGNSVDWIDTRSAVGTVLGERSFTAGIAAGMVVHLLTEIHELGLLLTMLALADYYDQQHNSDLLAQARRAAILSLSSGTAMLTATAGLFWPDFDADARKAFEERQALMALIEVAFQEPGKVFEKIPEEQKH